MQSLFEYLYSRESRRGEKNALYIRWGIAVSLLGGGLYYGKISVAGIALFLFMSNTFNQIWEKRPLSPAFSYLTVLLETSAVSLSFLFISRGEALLSPAISPFLWIYFILLYSASLRLNEKLILFSSVINIIGMNSVYLIRYISSTRQFQKPYTGANLPDQIIRTIFLMTLGLLLLNRPRIIRRILKNQQDFFDKMKHRTFQSRERLDALAAKASLSEREQDVLRELLKGKTYRMIGDSLCISVDTAKSHIKRLYRKLGVNSRNELYSLIQENSMKED